MPTSRRAQFAQVVVTASPYDVPPMPTALLIELMMTDCGLSFNEARTLVLAAIDTCGLPAEHIGRG